MKIIKPVVLIMFLLLLTSCSLIKTNSVSQTTSNNDTSVVTTTNNTSAQTTTTKSNSSSITTTKTSINPTDYSSLSLSFDNDINGAERVIEETLDSFTETESTSKGVKSKRRVNEKADINVYGTIDEYGFNFTGDFHEYSYFGTINEAALKVSAEPLSYAFGLLESFIQQGKALEDYSGVYYFYSNSNSSIRITCFDDLDDIIAVDYYQYHMIIGTNEESSFVLSYEFDDKGNGFYIEYETPDYSLIYLNSQTGFYGEIDSLIQFFDALEGFSGLPLYIMKEFNTNDEGEIIPLSPDYDEKDPSHRLLLNDNNRGYISRGILQNAFFRLKYEFATSNNNQLSVVEDGVLLYSYGETIPYTLIVPDGVKTIGSMTPHSESGEEYNDERYKNYYYAIYIPESVESIEKEALNEYVKTDYVFFESTEQNKDLEDAFLAHNPDVHFLYKGEWEIICGLYLPSYYHNIEEADHKHNFTLMITTDDYKAQDATCEHGTYYYYACEVCEMAGSLIYEVGEKTPHHYIETSRDRNFAYYQCQDCRITYAKDLSDTEHDYVLIEHKTPTCTEDGYDYYVCSITGLEKTTTIERYYHSFYNGVCARCRTSIDIEEHNFTLINSTKSCSSSHDTYRCSICGAYSYVETRNLPHNYVDGHCTMCGTEEHVCDYTNWFASNDQVMRYCTICGHMDNYYPEEGDLVFEYSYYSIKENYSSEINDTENTGTSLELNLNMVRFDDDENSIIMNAGQSSIKNNSSVGNIFYITITYKAERSGSYIILKIDDEHVLLCSIDRSSQYKTWTYISHGYNEETEMEEVLKSIEFYIYSGDSDLYIKNIKIVSKP